MESTFSRDDIQRLLALLGELLAVDGRRAAVVVVGGAALNLLGVVDRRTVDVDVIAVGQGAADWPPTTLKVADRLSPELIDAAARLARDLGLPPDWFNTTVTDHGRLRLPPGFTGRVQWQRLGGLWLGIAGRWDLIALKLRAAADTDVKSRHFTDLVALAPTATDLEEAAVWVRTQDAGAGFSEILDQVIRHVRAHAQ